MSIPQLLTSPRKLELRTLEIAASILELPLSIWRYLQQCNYMRALSIFGESPDDALDYLKCTNEHKSRVIRTQRRNTHRYQVPRVPAYTIRLSTNTPEIPTSTTELTTSPEHTADTNEPSGETFPNFKKLYQKLSFLDIFSILLQKNAQRMQYNAKFLINKEPRVQDCTCLVYD